MDRTEKTGLGVALGGHVLLFGALSLGWLLHPIPIPPAPPAIDVSLADEVGKEAQAPAATEAPAPMTAPELGAPEDAAPPAPQQQAVAQPAPTPPARQPEAAPPPKPAPKAAPPPPKVARPTPDKAKTPPKRNLDALNKVMADVRAAGANPDAKQQRRRGSLLGDDFRKQLAIGTAKTQSTSPRTAKIGAREIAGIADLIRRQVQPCYDLGALGGTSAMDIVTVLRLQFRPDGSVQAASVSEQQGVNADNRGYARQMAELSRRAVLRCAPLKGLPAELYKGGWEDFDMGFIPRQLG